MRTILDKPTVTRKTRTELDAAKAREAKLREALERAEAAI